MLYVEVVGLDEVRKSRLYRFLKYRLGDSTPNRVTKVEKTRCNLKKNERNLINKIPF